MSAALPDLSPEVRRAAVDALEELAARMMRGGVNLLRRTAMLHSEDPSSHRRCIAELRRYRGFKMPGSEAVRKIEAALIGQTEADSSALEERRRRRNWKEEDQRRERAEAWRIERYRPGSDSFRVAVDRMKDAAEAMTLVLPELERMVARGDAGAADPIKIAEAIGAADDDLFKPVWELVSTIGDAVKKKGAASDPLDIPKPHLRPRQAGNVTYLAGTAPPAGGVS